MIQFDGETFLRPSEIADKKLIVNSKGNGDYRYVLRLIKDGKLEARTWNESNETPYYIVAVSEIERYNQQFDPTYTVKL